MKLVAYPTPTLTAIAPAKGVFFFRLAFGAHILSRRSSILEYLSREDAERAVKDLDGKDLRGNGVRVTLDTTEVGQHITSPIYISQGVI